MRNSGTAPGNYNIAWSSDWLTATPAGGSLQVNQASSLVVVASAASLPAGIYSDTLRISTDSPQTPLLAVPITLDVRPPGGDVDMFLWPEAIVAAVGESGSTTLFITNRDALPATFEFGWAAGWLSVSPSSGAIGPSTQLRVTGTGSAANLATGIYRDTLRVATSDPDPPL